MKEKKQELLFDKNILFRLEKKLFDELDAFCKKRNWKKSFVIREAIKDYLRKRNEDGKL